MTTITPATISPAQLASAIAGGESITLLDVREDAGPLVEGPGVSVVRVPAAQALADPGALAADLPAATVVVCNRGVTAQQVASALAGAGRDVAVLQGGMRSWLGTLRSVEVDLGLEGATVHQVQRPGRGCLSYVVATDGRALVVDPAPDTDFYLDLADRLGARITDVVDTHLHADHISGARLLADRAHATLRLPEGSIARGVTYADRVAPLHDGDRIALGALEVIAIGLPGHTTDMTGLLVGQRALIGGDSLFADGLARPDLERGDEKGATAMARQLHATLHDRVLALSGDVVLLPGHTHPGVRADAVAPTLSEVRARVEQLAISDPDVFARDVLSDMPPRPANYEAIIAVNAGSHPNDPELEQGGNSCSAR